MDETRVLLVLPGEVLLSGSTKVIAHFSFVCVGAPLEDQGTEPHCSLPSPASLLSETSPPQ